MMILMAASALYLSAFQASIAAPTEAFRGCLRDAATKAKTDKIPVDGIEAYLKKTCTGQMGTLNEALIAFRIKNGMTRKAAMSDAAMTVDDYVSTPVDNYKFTATQEAKQAAPAAAAAAAPAAQATAVAPAAPAKAIVTPAAAPANPPSQPAKP